eukprot:CAMPEP_0172673856 /NCGR_PEP_ID=MMETSP1074-20121228/12409_1 /TAXON_ID=2916 /ORGANISM="Ceratium fusus, Strain PA161109" /LENGTH=52 /DNA_ID=CAMNT_0013491213 /DNA_START=101 /DNA_END=256 /DNA_ORIENTATION=-
MTSSVMGQVKCLGASWAPRRSSGTSSGGGQRISVDSCVLLRTGKPVADANWW